jgi:cytochrome P450
MPFGAGPRICVGAQFALTEATLVLARLLARFRIALAGTGAVLPRGIVTTQPDRAVRFVMSAR